MELRQIQTSLPWTINYSIDFRQDSRPHKDLEHALIHVTKACGKLAAIVDDFDHRRTTEDNRARDWIADIVICALRMANTYPGGIIDLQSAVISRLEDKKGVKLIKRTRIGHKSGCVVINCPGCGEDFYSTQYN